MKNTIVPALVVCCSLVLSGCDTFRDEELSVFNRAATSEGVRSLVQGDGFGENEADFELINLAALVDPNGKVDPISKSRDLNKAFQAFYVNTTNQKFRRNQLQDRILAASNQRCNVYKRFIKRVDSQTNLILGTLTTIAAGAGAIFTPVNTVRALSGVAGIFSGIRAEFNDSYFSSLAVQVITSAIDSERDEILKGIWRRQRKGFGNDIPADENKDSENEDENKDSEQEDDPEFYTLESAISDAIRYHGACGLIAGLERAALDIQRVKDPGLKRFVPVFKQLQKAGETLDEVAGVRKAAAIKKLNDEISSAEAANKDASKLKEIRDLLKPK